MELHLNSYQAAILKELEKKKLHSLQGPFIKLIMLYVLSNQSYKRIKKFATDPKYSKSEFVALLLKYFDKYGIEYNYKPPKRYPDRTVAKRVANYHKRQREVGKKIVSVYLSKTAYNKLQNLKKTYNKTNQEVIEAILLKITSL
jgi:hypothetical protein